MKGKRRHRYRHAAGVGNSGHPQLFLHPGDTVEVEIENIGTLCNQIADPV